jgi:hypothetical protein
VTCCQPTLKEKPLALFFVNPFLQNHWFDFWKEIGGMNKTEALAQLEKFFYQGLEHKGVQLPAAINFAHYTHGTGQVRSNAFINSPCSCTLFRC